MARPDPGITFIAFNQDQGCFTCCLKTGLRIYNVEPLCEKAHYSQSDIGEVKICEMVFRTNLLLLVTQKRPDFVLVLDDNERAIRAKIQFFSDVRCVCARREKFAVGLDTIIHVITIPLLTCVAVLPSGQNALMRMSLSTSIEALHLLAAPAQRTGSVLLVDVTRAVNGSHSSSPSVLNCHNHELACVRLSSDGKLLATASILGTVIRVFDAINRIFLYELRRGADYASIYCLQFNHISTLLSCISDKGTVHVWVVNENVPGSKAGEHVAIARASPNVRSLCAFLEDDAAIAVICQDGTFHKFTFTMGGTSRLLDCENYLKVGDDDDCFK